METKSEKLEMLASFDDSEISDLPYDWYMPIPIENNMANLPKFPTETLPTIIRDYVEAVAEHTQTPIDMSAIASLSVIASTLQGKYEIEGKEGYTETLNLYSLIIAKPAERKSAIMRHLTQPLYDYEREENKKRAPIIDQQTIELNIKRNLIKKCEEGKREDRQEENMEKAIMLQVECRELEEKQVKKLRLVADDCTPEALTSLLADNNGKIAVISTEGGLFDIISGRYKNSTSIDTILKAHCGDTIRVDRKGRETEYIQSPTMTILLAIQESVLEELMKNETFKGRGLNARFLYCKPMSPIGKRKFVTTPIPEEVKARYKENIFQLLEPSQENSTQTLKLSSEALEVFEPFYNWIEQELAGDLEFMSDWAGKLSGTCLRIAGILHLIDYSNIKNKNNVVSDTIMEKAIEISKYFLEHSKYAYTILGEDKEMQKAKFIIKKLEKQKETQLKRHEILRVSRSTHYRINVPQTIEKALQILVDYGYIREIPIPEKEGVGRKQDPIYELNPLYFK